MSVNDRSFAFAQLCYLLIVAGALIALPGASFIPTILAMAGVWIVVALCYQATSARNSAGWWALLAATAVLAVGVIANVHFFTAAQGATTANPVLNNIDARANFDSAMHILGHGAPAHAPRSLGYPLFIAAIWRITGITIVSPLIVNMLMTLLTAIACGTISTKVLPEDSRQNSFQWIQSCAIIMTLAICYLMTTGTVLLKDAGVCFAMAMSAIALTALTAPPECRKVSWRLWGAFAVGIISLGVFRLQYLMFIFIAAIVMTPWRDRPWRAMQRCAVMIGAIALIWVCYNYILIETWNKYTLGIALTPDILTDNFAHSTDTQHAYHTRLLSGYYDAPLWHQLLWLPVNAALIYLIPFPWDFTSYADFGYTYIYAKIAYPWYAVGGLVLFYFAFVWRRSPSPLRRLTIAAAILWLIPAYITAGSVSRYVLPLITWLIPAAVLICDQYLKSRKFRIYAVCYTVMIATTLAICYHIQHNALN